MSKDLETINKSLDDIYQKLLELFLILKETEETL